MKRWLILIMILMMSACTFPGKTAAEVSRTPEPEVVDSSCNNLLYPLMKGNEWVYRMENQGNTEQVGLTVSAVDNNQATLDALDINSGVISKTTAECAGTSILNFPLMTVTMIVGDYLNGEIVIEHTSGVFSPANDMITREGGVQGWEGEFIARGEVSARDEEEGLTMTVSDSPVKLVWEPVGREVVTVPAGTYENALTVKRTMTLDVTVSAEGMTLQGQVEIVTMHWFEQGIGLLKTRIDKSNLVFLGVGYPLGLQGGLELVEFHPAE